MVAFLCGLIRRSVVQLLFIRAARIKAAIAMSPSRPRRGGDAAESFGDVAIPWLLMTGTKDVAPIGGADLESRLAVFPALPPGGKYELRQDPAARRWLDGDGPRSVLENGDRWQSK